MEDTHLIGADSSAKQEAVATNSNLETNLGHHAPIYLTSNPSQVSIDPLQIADLLSDLQLDALPMLNSGSCAILKNLSPKGDDRSEVIKELQNLEEIIRKFQIKKSSVSHLSMWELMHESFAEEWYPYSSYQAFCQKSKEYDDTYDTLLKLNPKLFEDKIEDKNTAQLKDMIGHLEAFKGIEFQKLIQTYSTIKKILKERLLQGEFQLFQHLLIKLYPNLKKFKSFNENISERIWKYLVTSDLSIMIEKLEAKQNAISS